MRQTRRNENVKSERYLQHRKPALLRAAMMLALLDKHRLRDASTMETVKMYRLSFWSRFLPTSIIFGIECEELRAAYRENFYEENPINRYGLLPAMVKYNRTVLWMCISEPSPRASTGSPNGYPFRRAGW